MNKHIFVINGSGGSGKDTFVSMVAKYIPTLNFSSVDKIKEIARLIGWGGGKTEKDRKFLSDLKMLISEYNDMPYSSLENKISSFLEDSLNNFLFLHIREPEEIKRISDSYNLTTVLVRRPQVKHIVSNIADKNVFNYDYDIVIENEGSLLDLNEKAKKFVEEFKE